MARAVSIISDQAPPCQSPVSGQNSACRGICCCCRRRRRAPHVTSAPRRQRPRARDVGRWRLHAVPATKFTKPIAVVRPRDFSARFFLPACSCAPSRNLNGTGDGNVRGDLISLSQAEKHHRKFSFSTGRDETTTHTGRPLQSTKAAPALPSPRINKTLHTLRREEGKRVDTQGPKGTRRRRVSLRSDSAAIDSTTRRRAHTCRASSLPSFLPIPNFLPKNGGRHRHPRRCDDRVSMQDEDGSARQALFHMGVREITVPIWPDCQALFATEMQTFPPFVWNYKDKSCLISTVQISRNTIFQ